MKKLIFTLFTFCLALSAFAQIQDLTTNYTGPGSKPLNTELTKVESNFTYVETQISGRISKTSTRNRVTDNYTLALSDNFKIVEMNSADAKTFTVPANATVAFTADETQITLIRYGAGAVDIAAAEGVTIRSADGALDLRVQYSSAVLIKIGTNEWYLIGDLD